MAFALLATSLFALLAADTGYAIRRLGAGYNAGGLLDGIWMAESLVLGAAALHPTMAGITDPVAQQSSDLGRIRLAALYLVGIVAPVTLAARAGDADPLTELVTALAMVISMALIMIRMRCSESRQRRLANTDVITGLYTRRYLDRGLALAATAPVRPGATVSLLLVDIDHFKAINDQHGHPAGDRALAEIARRLRLAAGSDALVARYGGEEFAVLGRLLGPDDLRAAGERLRTSMAASPVFVTDDLPLQITVSVGAALAVPPTSPAELVCHADQALYAAKAQGRNRVVLADSLADGPAGATTGARRERADGVAALAGMTND